MPQKYIKKAELHHRSPAFFLCSISLTVLKTFFECLNFRKKAPHALNPTTNTEGN